jgi:hypothetical protein
MQGEFISRIGTFFLLLGAGIFILFIASEFSGNANFDYLFWSVLCVTIGFIMRRRKPPKPPSDRFNYVRSLRNRKHPEKGK